MLRRAVGMATAKKSRGLMMDRVPLSKGGRGRHGMAKPPTGRMPPGSSQSETSLVKGVNSLSLKDSGKVSASSLAQQRRPYSANRRPVTIKNVEDVATLLRENYVKNVVIVAGAGISTPSGIPDFRTPGTGLYDNLQQYSIPYAEAIFDIDYFQYNPRPFYTLAKELYPSGKYRPNYLHYFARLLHDRNLLLRMYTQNIDGLERIAGIPEDKMVEAHGTFSTATCTSCRAKYNGEDIKEKIFQDKIPRCERGTCRGVVKPDIVFFGEELPKRFYYYLKDMLQTDLVIIMGTSLEVQPFAGIIDTVRFTVPRLLFNRMPVGPFKRHKRPQDFVAAGDLLEGLQNFVTLLGWTEDMTKLITRKEGIYKLAFPPPVPPASDKKAAAAPPVKPNPLAAMWRQNAQLNIYSDSDSSDTDSAVTSTDSDTSTDSEAEPRRRRGGGGGGAGHKKGNNGGKGNGDSGQGSSVVSSSSGISNTSGSSGVSSTSGNSSSGAAGSNINASSNSKSDKRSGSVVNTSDSNLRPISGRGASTERPGALLNRRKNGNGVQGPMRAFSQQAMVTPAANAVTAATSHRDLAKRQAWAVKLKDGHKPPLAPTPPSFRKPTGKVDSRASPARFQATAAKLTPPAPGTHPAKPRSNSVTKAVPEKAHTKASDNLKVLYPRLKSADPVKLAYRHRLQPAHPYDARMLSIQAGASDSSSSDDPRDNDDNDESDDSSDSR